MRLLQYCKEAYEEMKRVVWPTRPEVVGYTFAVVAFSLGLALFFAILDYVLSRGLTELLKR